MQEKKEIPEKYLKALDDFSARIERIENQRVGFLLAIREDLGFQGDFSLSPDGRSLIVGEVTESQPKETG